jgi:hypothetical protein
VAAKTSYQMLVGGYGSNAKAAAGASSRQPAVSQAGSAFGADGAGFCSPRATAAAVAAVKAARAASPSSSWDSSSRPSLPPWASPPAAAGLPQLSLSPPCSPRLALVSGSGTGQQPDDDSAAAAAGASYYRASASPDGCSRDPETDKWRCTKKDWRSSPHAPKAVQPSARARYRPAHPTSAAVAHSPSASPRLSPRSCASTDTASSSMAGTGALFSKFPQTRSRQAGRQLQQQQQEAGEEAVPWERSLRCVSRSHACFRHAWPAELLKTLADAS